MIAGMTPIALALDPGAAQRKRCGIVVIGGLISSLLLTLVLVPVMFMWLGPRPHRERRAADCGRGADAGGGGIALMWLTELFVRRPTLVTVFLALVLLAGTIAGVTFGQAAVSELRRAVDPGAGDLSGRLDDRDARRDRAPARRSDRGCARPRSPRNGDPARSGLDRRRLLPDLGSEHGPRASARPRAERASTSCRTTCRRRRSRSTIRAKPSSSR